MKIMKKKTLYEAPELRVSSLELEGFICGSIKTQEYYVEVDETENTGVETLEFGW